MISELLMVKRAMCAVATFLVLCGTVNMVGNDRRSKEWALQPIMFHEITAGDDTRYVWFGVKNLKNHARFVCASSWSYILDDGADPKAGGEGSSHACRGDSGYQIVLANQTWYKSVAIPIQSSKGRQIQATFSITLQEKVPLATLERREATISWDGKVGEALELGRRLFSTAQ